MFLQTPRPFGQHSTSYRSMGNSMRSSTSMTNLPTSDLESGRASAPPTDFASVFENSRFGQPSRTTPSNTANSEETEISKGPGFIRVIKRQVIEDRSNGTGPGVVSNRRVYQMHKTTSLQDATTGQGRIFGQNLNVPQIEIQIPAAAVAEPNATSVFPVQRRFAPNQQPPPWMRSSQQHRQVQVQAQPEQSAQNVSPYHEEFQRSTSTYQTNRFRSSSAVPFNEYISRGAPPPQPIRVQQQQRIQEPENLPEARIRNVQFVTSQIPSTTPASAPGEQKPVVYQQLERRKNYATLHHVAVPKMGPLQRRTSDPNLLKIDDKNVPANIAMFNVAKGVRAELEQDPKFRKKADSLANETERVVSVSTRSPPSNREAPKQSPSLKQMENFFQNVQQFRTALDTKGPPPVPAPKPFNVEHVRSIFRSSDAPKQTPPTVTTTSIPTVPTAPTKQDSSILERAVNSVAEVTKAQQAAASYSIKANEGVQTFRITSRTIRDNTRDTVSTSNDRQSVQQNSASSAQTKPTIFVVGKPVVTVNTGEGTAANSEPKTAPVPGVVPKEIAILEQDYSNAATTVQQRLNQPFPVDETALISEKSSQTVASPPGIMKNGSNGRIIVNDSSAKTQKRVVFQCDKNVSDVAVNASETEQLDEKASMEAPPSVLQYDDAVDEPLQRLLKLSADIGGDLQTVGNKLSALFNEQRNFIWSAAGQKEPSVNELQAKLSPIVKLMEDLSTFKESKRNTPLFNHISAASEGVQAIGWLTVKPTPAPYIKEMLEAAMFFVNRVLKEHKDEKLHTEWAKSWTDVLNALQKYVRQVHTTGLVWNSSPNAKAPASAKPTSNSTAASTVSPAAGAPPPPPPPPVLPPDLFAPAASATGTSASDKESADRAALFAEINAGEEITKRLKKVTPDMQTHKNPALRSQHEAVVPGATQKRAVAATGGASQVKQEDKPPKTWLENGKQWNVEYHKNDKNVVVEIGDMKQTVYVYKCENSVIQVKGKVNSITLDSCKKTSIVFDSLLSQIEVINCQSVQIQTLGAMPTLSIQKTDGCQVYLSKESLKAEIITSKSSEMNVLVPAAEDGDFVEFPVPEQFKTVYDGKKLQTTVSDIC